MASDKLTAGDMRVRDCIAERFAENGREPVTFTKTELAYLSGVAASGLNDRIDKLTIRALIVRDSYGPRGSVFRIPTWPERYEILAAIRRKREKVMEEWYRERDASLRGHRNMHLN